MKREDLTGQVFGKLTAISFRTKNKMTYWLCKCTCGNTKEVRRDHLKNGSIFSCGCYSAREDLTGQVFNRLTAISFQESTKKRGTLWKWKCSCGNIIILPASDVKSGNTKSCGCFFKEKITKHNKYKTRVYGIWSSLTNRCLRPNTRHYPRYGGRGITICDSWLKFENFYADMGDPPEGYQIDRIDNNKGYYKENCRWTTPKENCRNKSTNIIVEFNGMKMTIIEWAEFFKIPYYTIQRRLKRGWDVEKALTSPPGTRFKN